MPAPAKALEDTIMEALLACLTLGQPSRDRAAPGRHRRIAAHLERALRERPEEMLSLSALCAEVGVAQRTLNLACEEFLGQSAMRYARGRRLDHVRQCLLMADPTATSVTGVAMQYGFWELGRFAQAYRKRSADPTAGFMATPNRPARLDPAASSSTAAGCRVGCALVCPDTMRFNTSVNHANGSTPLSFAVWISVATIAQCFPPLSAPAKRAFFRLCPSIHNVQRFSFGGAAAQAGPRGFGSWDPRR